MQLFDVLRFESKLNSTQMLPPLRSQERVPYHFYLIHSFFNPSSTPASQSIMSLTPSKMVLPTLKNRLRLRSIRLLCMSAPAAAKAISLFFSTSQRGKINSVMDSPSSRASPAGSVFFRISKTIQKTIGLLSFLTTGELGGLLRSFICDDSGWMVPQQPPCCSLSGGIMMAGISE